MGTEDMGSGTIPDAFRQLTRRLNRVFLLGIAWGALLGCLALGPPFYRSTVTVNGESVTTLGWREFHNAGEPGSEWLKEIVLFGGIALTGGWIALWKKIWNSRPQWHSRFLKLDFLAVATPPIGFMAYYTHRMVTVGNPWEWNSARASLILWFAISGFVLFLVTVGWLKAPLFAILGRAAQQTPETPSTLNR